MQEYSRENIKLSIIIPTYNTNEYLIKLLQKIQEQITNEIEVIIVDDFSNRPLKLDFPKWCKFIRLDKNSGTASKPRNVGLDNAKGEYIVFIDSDDMIADNYISKILKAIEKEPDIVFLSWKSRVQEVIMNMQPPKWNCAVWCRVYKKEIIGNIRFDETMRIAEDWKFNQEIKWKTKACIKDIIYYYNNGREGSLLNGKN